MNSGAIDWPNLIYCGRVKGSSPKIICTGIKARSVCLRSSLLTLSLNPQILQCDITLSVYSKKLLRYLDPAQSERLKLSASQNFPWPKKNRRYDGQ